VLSQADILSTFWIYLRTVLFTLVKNNSALIVAQLKFTYRYFLCGEFSAFSSD
jgi:hypothetical protein